MSADDDRGSAACDHEFDDEELLYCTLKEEYRCNPVGDIANDFPRKGLSRDRSRYSSPAEALERRPGDAYVAKVAVGDLRGITRIYCHGDQGKIALQPIPWHAPVPENDSHTEVWTVDKTTITMLSESCPPAAVLTNSSSQRQKRVCDLLRQDLAAVLTVIPREDIT